MQVSSSAPIAPAGATLPQGVHLDGPQLADLARRPDSSLPQLAPVGGSRVRLLVDEGEVLPDMLATVRGARRSIDLTMFSLSDSGAGKEVIDELIAKASSGVRVRVTIDQVGSAAFPLAAGNKMIRRMREGGVQVAVNSRVVGLRPNPVDHRKLLVVDDEVAYTGGMNLSKKFGAWHDVMVRIEGPAAAKLGVHFLDRWVDLADDAAVNAATAANSTAAAGSIGGRRTLPSTSQPRGGVAQAGEGVALLANFPGREMHASDHLLDNLAKATDRAWILTPTLSDPAVVKAMTEAAKRGVDVRVAVSGPEGWIGTRALRLIGATFYRELVGAGVKVYEQPGMSHAKVSLVDDVASVGSLNMTRRAMVWDHELMVASDERKFVGEIERLFETDFGKSDLISPEEANSKAYRAGELLRRGTGLKW